jgi:trigger factor
MKLEMTELGPVKRALKIEVPEDAVNNAFQQVFSELKRQVRVPGFRPGKAPIALLEKRYAREVERDVVQRLVPDYYQRAVKEAGVTPVVVEIPPLERIKIKRNEAFTFTATVEIKPKIELGDYRPPNPISLKPDTRTVTEEQIDQALQTLREQHAQIEAAPDDAVLSEGMHAIVTMEGLLEGEPLEGAQKTGHLHPIGSNAPVLGVEVDKYLIGKRAGEQVEIPQTYPEQHPDEGLAGKTVIFRLTIDSIKQKNLPALDDEFAKDCGDYETLDQLRTSIHTHLERIIKHDMDEGFKEQILERLSQMHHFDIPEQLIERELQTLVRQQLLKEHRHRHGQSHLDEPLRMQEEAKRLQQELQPEAKRRVKIGLVLEAIADKEGLTVEPDEIEEEIKKLARSAKLPEEEVRKMIEAGGRDSREEFEERIRAEKALQIVYQYSVIQG